MQSFDSSNSKSEESEEEREELIMAQLAAYYDGATGDKQKFI